MSQEFTCSHCKGAPKRGRFRRRSTWKTKRGFAGHRCYLEEVRAENAARAQKEREDQDWEEWLALGLASPALGATVFYSYYLVTGPRRVNGRRVRYEEIRRYSFAAGVVTEIVRPYDHGAISKALRDGAPLEHGVIVARALGAAPATSANILPTIVEAEEDAKKRQAGYDEHVKFSEFCR